MYLFNRKEGISLLFIFIISGMVNTLLKLYFNSPRPCHIDPLVSIIFSKSNGFPSGAAQTATIIAGLALMKCQKNIYKILAVVFALFVYFSRIYLGLHFFTDILGGIVVGIALLIIYKKIFPFIENHWVKFAIGLTALSLVLGGGKIPPQATMTLGIAIGLWFARQPELSSSWSSRILTFLIVIIGSTLFMYFGQTHPSIILLATFLAGLWIVYLGSYLLNKIVQEPSVTAE
jgi:hypothetical protein